MKSPNLTGNQLAVGAALNVLAAQAVAYGSEWPQGAEWVVVISSTLAALYMGRKKPAEKQG